MTTQSLGSSTTDGGQNHLGAAGVYTTIRFTASQSMKVSKITNYFSTNASCSRSITCSIYTRSGDTIGVKVGGTTPAVTSWGVGSFDFTWNSGDEPRLKSGSDYYLVFQNAGTGSGYVRWGETTTGSSSHLWGSTDSLSSTPSFPIGSVDSLNITIVYSPILLTDNLVAYYKLDETTGTSIVDSANAHNASTVGSPTLNQTGKLNKAIAVSNNNYIQTPTLGISSGRLTINYWIKDPAAISDNRVIECTENSNFSSIAYFSNVYYIYHNSGWNTGVTPATSGWHMITYTYDGVTERLYEDAVEKANINVALTLVDQTYWRIGNSSYGVQATFDGVGFWSEALGQAEITALNNSGAGWDYPFSTTSVPTVTTTGFSLVEETTATVSGNVTSDGGSTITERGIVYATHSSPTTSDSKQTVSGTTGTFDGNLTGLTEGISYYARAYAINSIGTSYGSDVEFYTKTVAPINFASGTITGNSIALSWIKDVNAEKTEVRRKLGSYPTSPTDGTRVYFDTANSVVDTGLSGLTTYYYTAYGWDVNAGYSDNYDNVMATTLFAPVSGISYFTANQFIQSSSISLNQKIITQATLISTSTSGSFNYYLSADGGVHWESVSNGVLHTFINLGNDLRFKIVEKVGGTGEITKVELVDY